MRTGKTKRSAIAAFNIGNVDKRFYILDTAKYCLQNNFMNTEVDSNAYKP